MTYWPTDAHAFDALEALTGPPEGWAQWRPVRREALRQALLAIACPPVCLQPEWHATCEARVEAAIEALQPFVEYEPEGGQR